ncbi:MAG: type 1 glutamine amidotransferase [Rhodocyclaceae bacterium]|nr:type 1 glutamine amidotransferase [Rhodocyclaceae bacterium]
MKPVAIFRHSLLEGPGYFATFLDRQGIPWRLVRLDAHEAPPEDAKAFSGLCFMGGPMSVNDDLPWIAPVLALIRQAVQDGIPVIGHCLGGQLMAKALGGQVTKNPVKEIGWGEVWSCGPAASAWLGPCDRFPAFHWHGETFSLPPNASHILASAHCKHQGFALGPHLALQCHVEMTAQMIEDWCAAWHEEGVLPGPSVQTPEQIFAAMETNLPLMRKAADRLYTCWLKGVVGA